MAAPCRCCAPSAIFRVRVTWTMAALRSCFLSCLRLLFPSQPQHGGTCRRWFFKSTASCQHAESSTKDCGTTHGAIVSALAVVSRLSARLLPKGQYGANLPLPLAEVGQPLAARWLSSCLPRDSSMQQGAPAQGAPAREVVTGRLHESAAWPPCCVSERPSVAILAGALRRSTAALARLLHALSMQGAT